VKGRALFHYEKMCHKIVQFLEQSYSVRISRIVLDFITDNNNKVWLFNCRSIRINTKIYMKSKELQKNVAKKTLDDLTCSVYCKLCGLIFKRTDASKTLTDKLLWELVQHLKKRRTILKDIHIQHNTTRPVRVCNLCYMLVVAEHELIEVEQKFAKISNIPLGDALIRVPQDIKPKHRPALLNEKLL